MLENFAFPVQIRWSDLDPNYHVRHSVYYDWGSQCRVAFFASYGLTTELMKNLHFGPIIFREECVFRKELKMEDAVFLTLEIIKSRKNYTRWTLRHSIMKNNETLGAVITIDGAFFDTATRKLTQPPPEAIETFSNIPLHSSFQWEGG